MNEIWSLNIPGSKGPVVAVALHDGHRVRDDLLPLLAVDEQTRLREEDPNTGEWTALADIQIKGTNSRFEVDLNRSRDEAVYLHPKDAWGINVWNQNLPHEMYDYSLKEYDHFYSFLYNMLRELEEEFGHFVVYDLHAYNHRRGGPEAPFDPPEMNPEVNIGTGTMNRMRWAPLVTGLIDDLRNFDFDGRRLDVRENVKFMGGGFPRFVHQHFPTTGCAIAIEFKKFWMDEWSGKLEVPQHTLILEALKSTVPNVRKILQQCC